MPRGRRGTPRASPCPLPAGMWPLGDDESQREMLNVGNVPAVPGAGWRGLTGCARTRSGG